MCMPRGKTGTAYGHRGRLPRRRLEEHVHRGRGREVRGLDLAGFAQRYVFSNFFLTLANLCKV